MIILVCRIISQNSFRSTMNSSREASQNKLWKHDTVRQKLKFWMLKKVTLRIKQGSEDLQKLKILRSYDKNIRSKRNLRHSRADLYRTNGWRTIHFKALSHPQEGIFVGTTLTLSISGAHLRIVLSYYYYSKWLSDISNCKVVELDFLTKEGDVQLSNCTSKFQLAQSSLQRSSSSSKYK